MKKKKRKNIYNLFHQYKINKTKLENKLKREKKMVELDGGGFVGTNPCSFLFLFKYVK